MRTLTQRELNRALLARQLLLERRRVPLVRAVERLVGMQAQSGPAPYVGLWTRVEGFRRETLERALLRRELVRAVLMRGTIHLVSLRDYGVLGAAVGDPSWVKPDAVAAAERLHDAVRAFGAVPRTRAEVIEWLQREHGLDGDAPGVWYALRTRGRLTHAPETGAWRTPTTTTYTAIEHETADPLHARVELVRRYLAAFGPATRADAAQWSGLRVRDLAPALEALEPLRRFRDERGRELLDLPRAPLPPPETPAPVRFLPRFDNLVLSHDDRTRVLPEEYRDAVIHGAGMVEATFLVDGVVAGLWRVDGARVVTEPFAPLPRAASREVEDEATRLAAWLGR